MTKSNTEPTRVQPSDLRQLADDDDTDIASRHALRAAADELEARDFRIDCLRIEHDEMAERLERATAEVERLREEVEMHSDLRKENLDGYLSVTKNYVAQVVELTARLELAEAVCHSAWHIFGDLTDTTTGQALVAWREGAKA